LALFQRVLSLLLVIRLAQPMRFVVNIIDESRLWRAVYYLRLILRFFLLLVDVWPRLFLGWSLWLAK